MTDEQISSAICKLRLAFGVTTTEDLIAEMVNRFLSWKLPEDFYPDAGISFDRRYEHASPHWPIGTNLLTADQATAMIKHMLNVTNR